MVRAEIEKAMELTAMNPQDFLFDEEGLSDRGYRVFPENLDHDPLLWFHGTSEDALRSILQQGFVIPASRPEAPPDALPSVSFAKRSAVALRYACDARASGTRNGGILAVRFASFDGVTREGDVLLVARADRMPSILRFCIVPASYRFV